MYIEFHHSCLDINENYLFQLLMHLSQVLLSKLQFIIKQLKLVVSLFGLCLHIQRCQANKAGHFLCTHCRCHPFRIMFYRIQTRLPGTPFEF